MKAVLRRIRRLEGRLAPQVDLVSQRAADLIRESRGRRLEANGQPLKNVRAKRPRAEASRIPSLVVFS